VVHNGTGRCTSFAIQTVDAIQSQHKGSFNFDYYRLGNHHLARCKNTGTVIDSSCKKGAFILQGGEEIDVVSSDERWICTWTFQSPEASSFQKEPKDPDRFQVCYLTHHGPNLETQQLTLNVYSLRSKRRPSLWGGERPSITA
jgi:hypothetical protein